MPINQSNAPFPKPMVSSFVYACLNARKVRFGSVTPWHNGHLHSRGKSVRAGTDAKNRSS